MQKLTISFNSLGTEGQLGNQMFQFASLVNLANKNNAIIQIPNPKDLNENYFYNYFKINKFISNLIFGQSNYPTLSDQSNTGFIKSNMNLNNLVQNINLKGYFQNSKYINIDESTIRNIFSFKDEYINEAKKIKRKINKKNLVLIHVRRGDYLNKKKYHYPLSKNYYKKAIKQFPRDTNFIIFSDDVGWCKRQKYFKKINIEFVDDYFKDYTGVINRDAIELCLMTYCDGAIISNSTFSWWGAWIQNQKNMIITPDVNFWFGYGYSFNADELLPYHWVQIKDFGIKCYIYKVKKFFFSSLLKNL